MLEALFIPQLIELLNENANVNLLERIFEYVEEVFDNDDIHLRNLLSITLLERLGNHKAVLETAKNTWEPKQLDFTLKRIDHWGEYKGNSLLSIIYNKYVNYIKKKCWQIFYDHLV
ncbi:DUF7674 family protein [Saccharibacillus alkalitolerans]